jgi:hypothetical protein
MDVFGDLFSDPATSVVIIENAWGAAYHWKRFSRRQSFEIGRIRSTVSVFTAFQ